MNTPRLALNFTTGVLDSGVTFTRATSASNPATYVASNGVITAATNNEPRFDYNPVTLVCKGLLIEESRSNLAKYSGDTSNVNWLAVNATKTSTNNLAPDGTNSAALVTANGVSTFHLMQPNSTDQISFTSGVTYTLSCFVKAGSQNYIQLTGMTAVFGASQYANFDLTGNGSTGTVSGGTAYIQPAGNGYFRISLTVTATATSTNNFGYLTFVTSATAPRNQNNTLTTTLYMWGAQVEVGASATSYIPTTTTALTRNADVATITGANFSSWWNAIEGSVLTRYRPSIVSGTRPIIQFDDTTADEIICLRGNTTNPELYIKDSTDQATIDAGTIAANTDYRFAAGWKLNDCAASINSGTPVLDGAATLPTVTQTRLGCDGTNYLNGHLQTIEYYNRKLTNGTLQQLASSAGRFSVLSPILRQVVQS